jgi:hypothetical protein
MPIPGATCVTEGNTCQADGDCCSKTCSPGHLCIRAGGVLGCHATGDLCFAGADCCTGVCSGATPTKAGLCSGLASMGSGGCSVDGEPCSAGTDCCSRVCAAIPGAGNICQIATGCRIAGDVCHADSDCCGVAGSGFPGAGEVTCTFIPGLDPPLGTCHNPRGNNPEGDVCGLGGASAREDCAGCMSPPWQCCRDDSNGVPRCYGGSSDQCKTGYTGMEPCCIEAGKPCTFSSECCGGNPCIPNPAGGTGLICSTTMCVARGGVCTGTGDCCVGLECIVPIGQPSGTCNVLVAPLPDAGPPVTSGPDAKPGPDAGPIMCGIAGQRCSSSAACCPGYNCDTPAGTPCMATETDCTCFTIIP